MDMTELLINRNSSHRHLAVRDFLRTHPDIAEKYGELKMDLADRFAGLAALLRNKSE